MSGARYAAKASRRRSPSISPKNAIRPAAWTSASAARKSLRNRRDSTRTGRRKPGLQRTQRVPSSDTPPPGTIIWTCGWWDGGTHAHNTLSAGNTDVQVQVFYPFHPLRGASLRILRRPKRGDGAVCVMDPAGRRLKIPIWMLLPECAEIKISQQPHLGKAALLSLASLITSQLDFKDRGHDNLPQTTVNGFEEGRRGATSTSGPDDPKGTRCRANGRSDTRRSNRSHGPRSGSGLSRGAGKRQ